MADQEQNDTLREIAQPAEKLAASDNAQSANDALIIADIEREAIALQASLAGASPERAAVISREINLLYQRLPFGATPPVALSNAAAAAESTAESGEGHSAGVADVVAAGALTAAMVSKYSKAVFSALGDLSPQERENFERYYNQIQDNQRYNVALLDENGNAKRDANGNVITTEVDGLTLKKDMLDIVKESLPPEKQKDIEEKTPEISKPEKRSEQLEKLEESLDRIQGKKLQEIEEAKGKSPEEGGITEKQAEEKANEVKETFGKARSKLRINREKHERKEAIEKTAADPNAKPEEKAMAKAKLAIDGGGNTEKTEKEMQKSLEDVRKLVPESADAPVKQLSKEEEKSQSAEKDIKVALAMDGTGHALSDEVRKAPSVGANIRMG